MYGVRGVAAARPLGGRGRDRPGLRARLPEAVELPPGRGSAEAWLFGIARNAALDELRRRKRHAQLEAEHEDRTLPGPDDGAELALRREVVRAALATLDARERDLVALKFAGGLSNAEIARVLGTSESNAGTRLHRTVTKLRKACDELA